jgi:glycerol uptake facilitator-like aquaporin
MTLARRAFAEGLGSLLLATTVIGSGIMASRLADGNAAIALMANTGATVAVLAVLIALLGPVSGAHLNPAVTLAMARRAAFDARSTIVYVLAQVLGCCGGALLAHAMFGMPLLQTSTHARSTLGGYVGEVVATAGLLMIITGQRRAQDAPWMIAAWIGGAYWFTSSTSFANPAITIARSLSDTFAGIRPQDVPAFTVAQLVGALAGAAIGRRVFGERSNV